MILHVAEICAHALGAENTFVATEDERIRNVVTAAGFQAVMTSDHCLTGTDRVSEAAEQIEADLYVNVQGDEPLLDPLDIRKLVDARLETPGFVINGMTHCGPREDLASVNIPKVVTNEKDLLVYMSRALIPGTKDLPRKQGPILKQVCIYVFSREELRAFTGFGRKSYLESHEDIEILRFLELGIPIRMVETSGQSLAVDVPEDIAPVENLLRQRRACSV